MNHEASGEDYTGNDLLQAVPNTFERWFTMGYRKVKIVATSVSLFVRLAASFAEAACQGWLRKQSFLFRKFKELVIAPTVVVLSSRISLPLLTDAHGNKKLDTLFQTISKPIANCKPNIKWFLRNPTKEPGKLEPERSVHVEVLHDPSPGFVKADVIFIHGLHGSLFNTWKQGLWSHRKHVQNLPLEHKYGVEEADGVLCLSEENISEPSRRLLRGSSGSSKQADSEYDHLLENITDLLNNIDDTIKESKNGRVVQEAEKEPYTPCWPRDWLPKDCPGVRVIAVNYTTDPFLWRPMWISKRIRSSMPQRSQQMEDILLELGVGQRPVVWVGHSKGGLFVKQMLVDARHTQDPRLSSFLRQTKGIMFYSVPHRGSSLAHWNLPFLRQSVELTEVKKDCQEVLDLHRKFLKLYEEKSLTAEVFSFVETILTFMFVTSVRVVSVDSADLGLGTFQGVNIDHREICKPLNRDCFLYRELTNLIDRVISRTV